MVLENLAVFRPLPGQFLQSLSQSSTHSLDPFFEDPVFEPCQLCRTSSPATRPAPCPRREGMPHA